MLHMHATASQISLAEVEVKKGNACLRETRTHSAPRDSVQV